MTASTVLRIATSTVVGILTGIVTNLATGDDAQPWMWLLVAAAAVASFGVALWAAPERGRSGVERDPVDRAPDRAGRTAVRERHGGTPSTMSRSSGVALALAALVVGLGAGLVYPNDRHLDPPGPVVVGPDPTSPSTSTGPGPSVTTPPPTSETVPPTTERPPTAALAQLVGKAWIGVDESWETLALSPDGTYTWQHASGTLETGRYTADGSRFTLDPDAGPSRTFGWSVRNALLTLTDREGNQRQYGLI